MQKNKKEKERKKKEREKRKKHMMCNLDFCTMQKICNITEGERETLPGPKSLKISLSRSLEAVLLKTEINKPRDSKKKRNSDNLMFYE